MTDSFDTRRNRSRATKSEPRDDGAPGAAFQPPEPVRSAVERAKGYRRLTPSMTALVKFEAVGRLASFTAAAAELGVTQAAVSRQVKILEDTLGVRLFDRLHRITVLTVEGEILYASVVEAMQKIAATFEQLSTGSGEKEFVLAATAAFTHFRLMPSLAELNEVYPRLRLRLTTTNSEVDAVVRYGNGKWCDGKSLPLFDEEVFPVCSASWVEKHGFPKTLQDIARSNLLEFDLTAESSLNWDGWFRALGMRPGKLNFGLRCALYTDAVNAARQGGGVALGWSRLIHDQLVSGELVRLTKVSVQSTEAYYVTLKHGRASTPQILSLIKVLRAAVDAQKPRATLNPVL